MSQWMSAAKKHINKDSKHSWFYPHSSICRILEKKILYLYYFLKIHMYILCLFLLVPAISNCLFSSAVYCKNKPHYKNCRYVHYSWTWCSHKQLWRGQVICPSNFCQYWVAAIHAVLCGLQVQQVKKIQSKNLGKSTVVFSRRYILCCNCWRAHGRCLSMIYSRLPWQGSRGHPVGSPLR